VLGLGTVETEAPAADVWALIARPARRHEWSPHVAGAEGLGEPEVEAGAVGSVVLRGAARIGAEILPTALIARNVARVARRSR
jgi:hypothetical protein